ncbi:MAG: MFS transporter, partial [Anaerolineales bacterium]
ARQGATGFQIGLLTAGPGVVSLFYSMPAGRRLRNKDVVFETFRTSFWHRLGYMAFVLVPWLVPYDWHTWSLVVITLLMSIPGTVLAIGFNAAFAELVPPELRARVVGRRNALLAVSTTLTSLACGQVLDRVLFPLNYQFVFALGAVGAMLSTFHLGRLSRYKYPPARTGKLLMDLARPGLVRLVDSLRHPVGLRFLAHNHREESSRLNILRGSFGRLMLTYLVFYSFQFLPIPLFPLFFVNDLALSDGLISLGSALFYSSMFLSSLITARMTMRYSHRGMLILGGLLYGTYPLFNGLASGVGLYLFAAFTGGIVWSIVNSGLVNYLMERVPEDDRPAHMAVHNIVLNTGMLIGALGGPLLVGAFGLRQVILGSGILRTISGIVFWLLA